MNTTRKVALILMAGFAPACSSLPHWGNNDPRSADGAIDVDAYEAYLERRPFGGKSDARRLRLAMSYLSAETRPHDPGKARNLLWQLEGSATSPYREAASRVLELLKDIERLRGASELERQRLARSTAEAARLRGAIEAAEERVAERGKSIGRLQLELQSQHRKLRRMEQDNASQKREIERLGRELRELKRIDTRQVH